MKIILNPKLQNEKIIFIQDYSSEENNESEENLSPRENYSQEDHLISSKLIQENHEGPKKVTPIIEQGMTSGDSFVEEEMKDRKKEDLIFKKLNIPWLSN